MIKKDLQVMSELFCRIAPGNRLDLFQEGRPEVLLSRNNLNAIHTPYAAHVSKQLTHGDYETSMISEYIGDDTEASS